MSGRVSIVVPCFNAEAFLRETVESVLAQTYRDWELILVDDGSRDGTPRLLSQYATDPCVSVVTLVCNSGVPVAKNFGTLAVRGDYVLYLDSDDLLTPTALEDHVRTLQDADVSYAQFETFTTDPTKPVSVFTEELPSLGTFEKILAAGIGPGHWWVQPGAVMARRSFVDAVTVKYGGWANRLHTITELHYYACLYQLGARFAPTRTLGLRYRSHSDSLSRRASLFDLAFEALWLVDFWIKERGPEPALIARRLALLTDLQSLCRVEAAFSDPTIPVRSSVHERRC
jgi:glycosyltransferase involved in cell wall biosynthesis